MFNPVWLFIIASIIAVIGIITAFKKLIASIGGQLDANEWNETSMQKANTRYFIHLALIESIPIILIIFGLMQMENAGDEVVLSSKIIATIVILGFLIFGIVNMIVATSDLMKNENLSDQDKQSIRSLPLIGIGTLSSIPLVCLISIFLI